LISHWLNVVAADGGCVEQVFVGNNADQFAVVHHRSAADVFDTHQIERVNHGHIRRNGDYGVRHTIADEHG